MTEEGAQDDKRRGSESVMPLAIGNTKYENRLVFS